MQLTAVSHGLKNMKYKAVDETTCIRLLILLWH